MQVSFIVGANAYARIQHERGSLEVLCPSGAAGAAADLRAAAAEQRARAAETLRRAELCEQAAAELETR
jgi:hypothetical protein